MKNNSSDEADEEDKYQGSANPFAQYSQPVNKHTNPLVHNKGSVHFLKETIPPPSKENVVDYLKPTTYVQEDDPVIKKGSIASICSNISEFDQQEKQKKADNLYLLPLFEIHGTMQHISQNSKLKYLSSVNIKGQVGIEPVLLRSHSIRTEEKENIKVNPAVFSETQTEYIKNINSITTNYICHVLNNRDLYFQYVSVCKSSTAYTYTEHFITQVDNLMKQKNNYIKNIELYHSNKCNLI